MTLTEDLDTFLADFGVAVTFNSQSYVGVLDMPDQIVGGGLAISTEYSLLVQAADLPESDVDRGDSITVDGSSYIVREYHRVDDGKFAKIILTKAS